MADRREEMTRILRAGDPGSALDLVYDELRALAGRRMARERPDHTLQATALVHEAYLRLVDQREISWDSRTGFFVAASEAMRRILVDHARRVNSLKRGGDQQRVTLGPEDARCELPHDRAVAVHDALDVLAQEEPRTADVVRCRFLLGLSVEETASALSISVRSVHREWTYGRARLFELLGGD